MRDNQHLLLKHNILVSFNVSKVVKQSYINNLRKKLKENGKTQKQINKEVDKKITSDTQKFIEKNNIPGFKFNPMNPESHISDERRDLIFLLANNCIKFCKKYNFTKEEAILFTQLYLHLSNVTNYDVQQFKIKNNLDTIDDDNYYDEDEGDDEDIE